MEELIVILKEQGKNEIFIRLIKKMFKDNNIDERKGIEILKLVYK